MKRKLIATLCSLIAAFTVITVSTSVPALATCTGSPGCDSGWQSTTTYYVSSHTNVNIDIHWTADSYNTRTFYFSGSNCSFSGACVRLQEQRLYYWAPCGCWSLLADYVPGPAYGSYSYKVLSPSAPTPRYFITAGRDQYGHWVNSPQVYN
jgi:hypothetical protein